MKRCIGVVWRTLLLSASLICGTAAASTVFGPPVDLTNLAVTRNFHPSLVGSTTAAGVAYVVCDSTPVSTGLTDVLFFSGSNNGANWSAALNLSNDGDASFPQIAEDASGNLYVVWQDVAPGHTQIIFSSSADGGQSWTPPLNISQDSGNAGRPRLTVDSTGTIYVVWQDTSTKSGSRDIFLATSSNGGASFGAPVDVSGSSHSGSSLPAVVWNQGTVSVVWTESSNIYLAQSTNAGSSFSSPFNLTSSLIGYSGTGATAPSLAADSYGNLDLVFTLQGGSSGKPVVEFATVDDGGAIVSAPVAVQTDGGTPTQGSVFVGADGVIRISWFDNSSGQYHAYYVESSDGGMSFSNPLDVSKQAAGGVYTVVGEDVGGNVYQAWEDSVSGYFQIYSATGKAGVVSNLKVSPNPFSPNGDGVQDTTTVSASFSASANWKFTITTPGGFQVNSFSGTGSSMSVSWNGLDSRNYAVPGGTYNATVSGTVNGVTFPSSSTTIVVNKTPAASIYSYSAQPSTFNPTAGVSTALAAQFTVPMSWTITVADSYGNVDASFSGSGGSASASWNGTDPYGNIVAAGAYTATLSASSGSATFKQSLALTVVTASPQVSNFLLSPSTFSPTQGQSATFSFTLNETCLVTIEIFNSANTLLDVPERSSFSAGNVSITWPGTNASGTPLSPGTYIYDVYVRDTDYQQNVPYPITGTVTIQ